MAVSGLAQPLTQSDGLHSSYFQDTPSNINTCSVNVGVNKVAFGNRKLDESVHRSSCPAMRPWSRRRKNVRSRDAIHIVLQGFRIRLNGYLSRYLNVSGSEVTGLTMLTLEVRSNDRKRCKRGGLSLAKLSVSLFAAQFSLFSRLHSINNANTAKISGVMPPEAHAGQVSLTSNLRAPRHPCAGSRAEGIVQGIAGPILQPQLVAFESIRCDEHLSPRVRGDVLYCQGISVTA
jgi:hypothetical protein